MLLVFVFYASMVTVDVVLFKLLLVTVSVLSIACVFFFISKTASLEHFRGAFALMHEQLCLFVCLFANENLVYVFTI